MVAIVCRPLSWWFVGEGQQKDCLPTLQAGQHSFSLDAGLGRCTFELQAWGKGGEQKFSLRDNSKIATWKKNYNLILFCPYFVQDWHLHLDFVYHLGYFTPNLPEGDRAVPWFLPVCELPILELELPDVLPLQVGQRGPRDGRTSRRDVGCRNVDEKERERERERLGWEWCSRRSCKQVKTSR